MVTNESIPETPPDYDQARVIERPDGFYWQDKDTEELYGPFPTLLGAVQDMQDHDGNDYEEGESLEEAESEIGMADWIDPETGEPAEESPLHLSDE
ncbi:hypothetical protein [Sideroxydans lithotrophicus]|uniref:Uncharacterized protein n=1 Tax=Sideroxydans lithotrophicus (strain ES-1) TaxID=580332 RepID=D5CUJ3_SIDLE|nr:hypothetical protein [Sideroxydans lithotrophicus]ADE12380.1 conserved hypothetical protein [Sideroxydans lithotrophicus ES-1]